ncbi:MAG: hypothetical protein ACRCTP_03725 [Aeromonas popoffii]|uniref:hypothetical protein n=1 Tax=Aeromonas popoffii TaxID=70856 RepID=UPI003F2DF63E
MNKVEINGRSFSGKNITIDSKGVVIDGKRAELGSELVFNVTVIGEVQSIDGANSVKVTGPVGSVKTMSGEVECGDVTGNVSTMSGDITANNIAGSVKTMSGDIIYKKSSQAAPVVRDPGMGSVTGVE